MKKITGIYKIKSPSGRIYIGSSNDINNRLCSYRNLKCKNQTKLYNSFIKYGWKSHIFKIIEECEYSVLLEKELYYGLLYNVLDKTKGLNCRLPKIGDKYSYMSEETKEKISKGNLGKKRTKYIPKKSLRKLNEYQVLNIKKMLIENELTQKEIGRIFSVGRKVIGSILLGKTYKTVGLEIDLSLNKKKYVKLNKNDYEEINNLNKKGMKQTEISKIFNVDSSHISRILNKSNYIKTMVKKEGEVCH